MPFKKMNTQQHPPRQWALVGYPGTGKSTFASQMAAPMLVVDADHRFTEVAGKATGEVYELSDNPADNVDAEQIAKLLRANMAGSGVKTVIVDSLTSILSPLVVEAIMDNDAGRNKNRVSAFKDKALAMRLLQDTITGWGCHVLWIYHLRDGLDGKANKIESTTISAVELARLRRSLNMQLRIVHEGNKRGVKVEWARRGRSGMTLWDETDLWRDMPEKIEQAVYGGLTVEDQERIADQTPTKFANAADAVAWGFDQGCFRDAVHAQNAYDKVRSEKAPKSAQEMWTHWTENVKLRCAELEDRQAHIEDEVERGLAVFA
jgi:hypothetical protein